MKRAPKVGQRVRYYHAPTYDKPRTCEGVITAVHPCGVWVPDGRDEYGEETGRRDDSRPAPEAEWQVTMKVDAPLPVWWPYPGTDLFCPEVSALAKVSP